MGAATLSFNSVFMRAKAIPTPEVVSLPRAILLIGGIHLAFVRSVISGMKSGYAPPMVTLL